MVMNYKNKKKNVTVALTKKNVIVANGSTKKSPQGSRFTPLQNDDSVTNEHVVPSFGGNTKQNVEPTIVKL